MPSADRMPKDAAKVVKDAARSRTLKVTKTVLKAAPKAKKPKKTVLKAAPEANKPKKTPQLKTNHWTYNEEWRVYSVEPQRNRRPDVHKYTLVYLHHANGKPWDYFEMDPFQTPGLRVVLPEGRVYQTCHGLWAPRSKVRLWYDYHHGQDLS